MGSRTRRSRSGKEIHRRGAETAESEPARGMLFSQWYGWHRRPACAGVLPPRHPADLAARPDDAQRLWNQGRNESALVLLLTPVASCARMTSAGTRRTVRAEFESFFNRGVSVGLTVEFRGRHWPIESIFYKRVRRELVHDRGLPADLEPMPDAGLGVRAGGSPEFGLKVSRGWFACLMPLCRKSLNPCRPRC